jgi:hypothetical protein
MDKEEIKNKLKQIEEKSTLDKQILYLKGDMTFTFLSTEHILIMENTFVIGQRFVFNYDEVEYLI